MTPTRFLTVASLVLTTIGALGVTHQLGRISRASFFNPPYWINWVHLLFGPVVLVVRLTGARQLQNTITLGAAVTGTTLGVAGLAFGPAAARRFDVPELADPSDHLGHLTVGLLALWGWRNRRRRG